MEKKFNNNLPIYSQLMDIIKISIVKGRYLPGTKIPSVRDLASEHGVNPNTMQKALTKLEDEGLLYAQRTSGRFITKDESKIDFLKSEITKKITQSFINKIEEVGIEKSQLISYLNDYLNNGT